jgi:hypothetical protein
MHANMTCECAYSACQYPWAIGDTACVHVRRVRPGRVGKRICPLEVTSSSCMQISLLNAHTVHISVSNMRHWVCMCVQDAWEREFVHFETTVHSCVQILLLNAHPVPHQCKPYERLGVRVCVQDAWERACPL